MGTQVQCRSSLPGFYPMRELNDDSDRSSRHLFYGERAFTNAQYHNVVTANGLVGEDKDVVRQKMLEHEAIFKNQVFELHRLYRRQRDLMDKIKSAELSRNRLLVDPSQLHSEDASRRNLPWFPTVNSSGAKFSISGGEGHSSMISEKPCFFTPPRESARKDVQVLESRLTKFRRRMLDLQLPADEYIDSEDEPDTLSHNQKKFQWIDLERDVELYADDGEGTRCLQNARKSDACLEKNMSCLTDLNEPIQLLETNTSTSGPKSDPTNLLRKSSLHSTENGRVEQSRDALVSDLQFTKRSREIKGERQSSFFSSHTSTLHPVAPDFSKSNSSWESASATMHKNFHSPCNGKESFGEKWLLSNDSELLTKRSDSDICYNRVFLGFSSEFKEEVRHPSSVSCNYWKQCNGSNRAPNDLSPSMSLKLFKDSNPMDIKCAKEINFSMGFSNSSSNQAEMKFEENCTLLPWLRGTTCGNTKTTDSGRLSCSEELINVRSSIDSLPGKNSHSFRNDVLNKEFESVNTPESPKHLALSVSGALQDSRKAVSSFAQTSVPSETKDSREKRVFDLNLPCVSLVVAESDDRHPQELNQTNVSSFGPIDLNLSLSDEEESPRPTPKSTFGIWGVIDLEAPAEEVIETISKQQRETINQQDELLELAAEAIVSISSSVCRSNLEGATFRTKQESTDTRLNQLVEIALLCSNDYESESRVALMVKPSSDETESLLDVMDCFESMTLSLTETKAEKYMPMSLVPANITIEENATNLLQNRPRKGQARRGRQRRDFQRDILPGLTSLSRQEVAEDINTFGGLMREMGHEWNSGSTKRNSSRNAACGRGRRQTVISPSPQPTENLPLLPQPGHTEMGLDNGSLTGWGKTTRRPRRQRVAAGNLATIALV